jgi:hypothetical protein
MNRAGELRFLSASANLGAEPQQIPAVRLCDRSGFVTPRGSSNHREARRLDALRQALVLPSRELAVDQHLEELEIRVLLVDGLGVVIGVQKGPTPPPNRDPPGSHDKAPGGVLRSVHFAPSFADREGLEAGRAFIDSLKR